MRDIDAHEHDHCHHTGAGRGEIVDNGSILINSGGSITGTVTALGLKVHRYDPAVHYNQVRDKWIGTDIPDGR